MQKQRKTNNRDVVAGLIIVGNSRFHPLSIYLVNPYRL